MKVKLGTVARAVAVSLVPAALLLGAPSAALGAVPPDATATATIGGAAVNLITTAADQNSKVTFTGAVGQRLAIVVSANTYSSRRCVYATLKNPAGTVLTGPTMLCGPAFFEPITLAAAGTYTLAFDPRLTATGKLTIRLYNTPADATAALTLGTPRTITTTVPGQNSSLTFSGTTGQRVGIAITANTYTSRSCVRVTLKNPSGVAVGESTLQCTTAFLEPPTLAATGTYTLAFDPSGVGTGALTLKAHVIPADATATATVGGAAVTLATTTAGQNSKLNFTATAGQRIGFVISTNTYLGSCVTSTPKNASDVSVAGSTLFCGTTFLEPVTFATAGSYALSFDPVRTSTGALTIRAYATPADAAATLTLGTARTLTTTVPGQNAKFTFSVSAPKSVTIMLSGSTLSSVKATIRRPDGTTLATKSFASTSVVFANLSLPVAGAYTLTVDPAGARIGSITAR